MGGWADLPEELLHMILPKLFDGDRYNFKLVCRSWNGVAVSSPYKNTPCLIYYDSQKNLCGFFQYKSFFYRRFPEFEDAEILCCRYGWLLMARRHNSRLFFWDPFNERKVEVNAKLHDSCSTSINFFGPPTSPDCFILGVHTRGFSESITVGVLKYGSKKWSSHTLECGYDFWVSLATPVLHHELVYFVGMKGDIATVDIKSDPWAIKVYTKCLKFPRRRNMIRRHYLFKINGDDALYSVFTIHDTETVNLFRLSETDMTWERVKDLGNRTLYLSRVSCYGDVDHTKSMENTICFPTFDVDNNPLFYSLNARKYHPFEGDYSFHDFINVTRLDYGVAWILPVTVPVPSQQLLEWCPKV